MTYAGSGALALALLLAACAPAGPRLGGLAPSGVLDLPGGGVPLAPEHTLSAGDEFEIRLPFDPEHNDRVTVAMDGTVAPKAVGIVAVGGLTIPEAAARLKMAYARVLKAPQLSLTMRRYAPEVFYVDGWVRHPGLVRSDVPLTVARAVAQAGGMKTGAKTSDILILRHGSDGTVHTYSAALGNFAGAPIQDAGAQDPLLKSFDVVYVPQTPIEAIADFARQYYTKVPFSASYNLTPQQPSVVVPPAVAPVTAPAPTPPPVVR